MSGHFDLPHSDTETTVHEAFERMRRLIPTNPFLHIPAGGASDVLELTYEQARSAVDAIIGAYRQAGFGRHHHVALVLESRADFYLHWLALNQIGATLVPIGSDLVDRGDEPCPATRRSRPQSFASRAAALRPSARAHRIAGLQIACPGLNDPALPRAHAPRSAEAATRRGNRVYLGKHRAAEGLHAIERVLSHLRTVVPRHGRALCAAARRRALHHAAASQSRQRPRLFEHGRDHHGRVHRAARSIQIGPMVGDRPSNHAATRHALSGRDAQHVAQIAANAHGASNTSCALESVEACSSPITNCSKSVSEFPLLEAWGDDGKPAVPVPSRPTAGRGMWGPVASAGLRPKYSEARIVDEHGKSVPPGTVGELVVRATGADPRRGYFFRLLP